VALVAISPELPDQALTTANKTDLDFTVLSDVGNKLARQLDILFQLPDAMRPLFKGKGIDLKERNGDDSFQVPFLPRSLWIATEQSVILSSTRTIRIGWNRQPLWSGLTL